MTREIKTQAEVAKAVRTRSQRQFGLAEGPLSFLEELSIPGFHLRLINEVLGSDKFRLSKVQSSEIGYEFVHPSEVGLNVSDTTISDGQRVRYVLKNGINAYLMKRPVEWENEDRLLKKERNEKGVKAKIASATKVSGSDGFTDAGVTLK